MITKQTLVNEVEHILERGGFSYCEYAGCFDILARKKAVFSFKVLCNIDSFQESQSVNLSVISHGMGSLPSVVGLHTRKENLEDNVVYERFGIPAFTPNTLERMLINELYPVLYRFRGGFFAEVNSEKLKEIRKKKGMTQQQLAKKVGITKKNIYEHEKEDKMMKIEVIRKIESTFDFKITKNIDMENKIKKVPSRSTGPNNIFERWTSEKLSDIGFETSFVRQAPFNIIAKEKSLLLSDAEENFKSVENNIPHLKNLAEILKQKTLIITNRPEEHDFGLPVISSEDLKEITSSKGIWRIIKKK